MPRPWQLLQLLRKGYRGERVLPGDSNGVGRHHGLWPAPRAGLCPQSSTSAWVSLTTLQSLGHRRSNKISLHQGKMAELLCIASRTLLRVGGTHWLGGRLEEDTFE